MRVPGSVAVGVLAIFPLFGVAQPPAADSPLPPPDRTPKLVIRHAGPHAPVGGLAFAPDGTLYAGGFGKIVHRYALADGKFAAREPLRVPVGPGNAGAINAVAVSPDGKWVAVAGRAPIRGETWAGSDDGITVETRYFPQVLKGDYGVVYLINPADPQGGKVIRGMEAGVRALAFATPGPAAGPVLVTAGVEWDRDNKFGTVRVHDVATGKELISRNDLPETPNRPGLAAWVGSDKALRVAVAWPKSNPKDVEELLVWDTSAKRDSRFPDGLRNFALALRTGPDGAARELVSGALVGTGWGLVARPADPPAAGKGLPLAGKMGEFVLPLSLAPVGGGTAALLLQVAPPPPAGATGRAVELRLVAADAAAKARVALKGVSADGLPTLTASPDGKWLAVAGFADNRIEVYDAAALADGKAVVQTLAGAPGGYARVAFLAGNSLWLGGTTDEAPRGGIAFDLATRKAAPAGAGLVVDAGGGPVAMKYDAKANTVTVAIDGKDRAFSLREDEVPTAAAYLPAGPAWDKALGPVVAVAHYHRTAFASLVTLFDATDGRKLLQLGGPTLRVDGLAFSGSRPLLAAVGPDRTVAVWSLKALATPFAAIEGVAMVERDGKLAVASVSPTSPARAALKADDVVEAVGGEKGNLRPVTTYREFLLAVRELPVGGTARVQVKGAAPVAVPVGRGVGHRHPLFEVWIDPVAKADGTHDWIGWTPAGPYDSNSPTAEARLGWLTATGKPAEPVVYAGADQYRRLYYKADFLRFLADAADFDAALKRHAAEFPRTAPVLTIRADGVEERDGVRLLRTKPAGLGVRLDDPDGVTRLDEAVLRWRLAGLAEWRAIPFRDGEATLPLAGYAWARGEHRFEFEVRESPDLPPVATTAAAFQYVPPAPTVAVRVNGAAVAPGAAPTSVKDEVELAVDATTAPGVDVVVTATTTGPGGDRPVTLPAGKDGRYGPVALKLDPTAKTAIRVTARNAGAGDFAKYETDTADVIVWHAPPVPKAVPRVALAVVSPVDAPSGPGRPFVSETAKVRLAATIAAEGMTKIEWDDGKKDKDGKDVWVPGALPAAGAAATREVTFDAGGVPRALRVRVTANDVSRTDAVSVVWAALPTATFGALPATVRDSALLVAGPAQPAAGGGPYSVQVVVEPVDSASPHRGFPVGAGDGGGWKSAVELSPGVNRLALVVKNEWKELRCQCCEVRYVRPPLVAGVEPIAARGAEVGDVVATVVSPAGVAPDRLALDDRPLLAARAVKGPVVFGLGLWRMKAEAVPLATGGVVPRTVRVSAGSAEGDGDAVIVPVIPIPPAPPPPPPPEIIVTAGKNAAVVAPGGNVTVDEAEFALDLRVASAVKITRVELRRPDVVATQPNRVPGVSEDKAVEENGRFTLTANPTLTLREGVNVFEVAASNGLSTTEFRFSVSYTPPPVRVVVEEIAEAQPGGGYRVLPRPAGGAKVDATSGLLRVRGKIVFSGAARATGYDIVLYSNDVRHVPVPIEAPAPGKSEIAFESPLFLNTKATNVRVEVARRRQTDPLPQQLAETRLVVETTNPITQQRLHVVVLAPEEPEGREGTLAREVIVALNGEFIGNPGGFTEGLFKHKAFTRATLYRPLVHSVNRPDIVGQLHVVEAKIREQVTDPGKSGFVNDVVIVYYQGRDLMGRDGVRRVHTTRSLVIRTAAEAERHAVRLDELPVTSGVRFVVLNVVTPDGKEPLVRVTTGPMLLRYVWQNRESFGDLLEFYRVSIGTNPTVGTVVDWVRDAIEKLDAQRRHGLPTDTLTPTVRERMIGSGQRPRP